jgi:RNA polymerase sigma factor (sigma-70 family)
MADGQVDRNALYEEFAPLVQKLIRQYGTDPELRLDLQGELYYRFCALLDAYDSSRGVPLRAYIVRQLTASAFTYARHHWRQSRREADFDTCASEWQGRDISDPTNEWDEAIALDQFRGHLSDAITRLPRRQSHVLMWRYFEDRSFDDIADALNVQPATVRSLLRHAVNNLRRQFGSLTADFGA